VSHDVCVRAPQAAPSRSNAAQTYTPLFDDLDGRP